MLGMLFMPLMRRISDNWLRLFMAVTIGLLAFLALDGDLEGIDIGPESGGAFGGAELIFLGAGGLLPGADRARPQAEGGDRAPNAPRGRAASASR